MGSCWEIPRLARKLYRLVPTRIEIQRLFPAEVPAATSAKARIPLIVRTMEVEATRRPR